jgi:hypothetical protein
MAIEQRTDVLVRDVRARTGNRTYDYQSGIAQREFVEALQDGQERLFNLILQERSTLFRKQGTPISAVAGQATYTLPTDVYLQHNINKIDYSPTGQEQDYSPLDARISKEELSVRGYPDSYFLRDGSMIISPIPDSSTGTFRLEYQYTIPSLDLRRATYTAVGTSGGYVTSLTLAYAAMLQESKDDLTDGFVDYVGTVDATGAQEAVGMRPSGFTAATGVLTFPAATYAVADYPDLTPGINSSYLVFGRNASTHSSLPQVAKRYLVEYASARIQIRDANALEAALTSQLMQSMERDIVDAYASLEEDSFQVPILDYQYLGDGE